jgi:hypothetical protein
MAQGKTVTVTKVINNKPKTTVVQTVEAVVVNNQLVADDREINPGVNTRTM